MRLLIFSVFLICTLPVIFLNPYIGVLLYSWLSFMSPQRLAWGFPNVPLALIVAVLTLVVWLASKEPKRLPSSAVFWLILVFMAYVSFTTLFALNPALALEKWQLTLKSLFFVLVTIAMTTNRVRLHAVVWIMVASIGFYAAKGGLATILGGGENRVYGPADTMIYDNNHIAVAVLVAVPLMNYLRLTSAHRWVRVGLLGLMGFSLIATVGTYSRGALLALAAMGVFLWLNGKNKLIGAIAIPLVMICAVSFMPEKWYDRMATIERYEEDASATYRLSIWDTAFRIATARPFIGGGFGSLYSQQVVDTYNPGNAARAGHSIYFEVIGEHGFLAFAIWCAIPIIAWLNTRRVIQAARDRANWSWAADFARMVQVSLIVYLVGGAFLSLSYWDYYFTIVGLLAAVRAIIEREQTASEPVDVARRVSSPAPLSYVGRLPRRQ